MGADQAIMKVFFALCHPTSDAVPQDIPPAVWDAVAELARNHGLSGFFYYRAKNLDLSLPETLLEEWKGAYLFQGIKEAQSRRQINRFASLLAAAQIPIILLKGGSAIFRLYPQTGLRSLSDLDLLIDLSRAGDFYQTMFSCGYRPNNPGRFNSPEDRRLCGPIHDTLVKENAVRIDPHGHIFTTPGVAPHILNEIWMKRTKMNEEGLITSHLDGAHFIIHTAVHLHYHLFEVGFASVKGLVDLLLAGEKWQVDWDGVQFIARRWKVEERLLPVMATLRHLWQLDLPIPPNTAGLDLRLLLSGDGRVAQLRQEIDLKSIPGAYWRRVAAVRELPDTASRIRYLWRLFFPVSANLRWRYDIQPGHRVWPYYPRHLFTLCARLAGGARRLLSRCLHRMDR